MKEALPGRARPIGQPNFSPDGVVGGGSRQQATQRQPLEYINRTGKVKLGGTDEILPVTDAFYSSLHARFAARDARVVQGLGTSLAQEPYPASVIYHEVADEAQRFLDEKHPDGYASAVVADAFLAHTYSSEKFDPEQKLAIANNLAERGLLREHDRLLSKRPSLELDAEQEKTVRWLLSLVDLQYRGKRSEYYYPDVDLVSFSSIIDEAQQLLSSQKVIDIRDFRRRKQQENDQ